MPGLVSQRHIDLMICAADGQWGWAIRIHPFSWFANHSNHVTPGHQAGRKA
jgi:hypothetical protein